VGVYRKHHPAYRELIGRIKATNRLIDLVVYWLYGLTEEEIAIAVAPFVCIIRLAPRGCP